jgi:hypothetical protein
MYPERTKKTITPRAPCPAICVKRPPSDPHVACNENTQRAANPLTPVSDLISSFSRFSVLIFPIKSRGVVFGGENSAYNIIQGPNRQGNNVLFGKITVPAEPNIVIPTPHRHTGVKRRDDDVVYESKGPGTGMMI